MEARHETVLLTEAIEGLAVERGDVVVDATIGGAGHFSQLYALLSEEGTLIGIDADEEALERARVAIQGRADGPAVKLVNDNFRNLARILDDAGTTSCDRVLFDLGWSGFQLVRGKGFSFQADEPLIMTYGADGESAAALINSATETELADLIHTYGEERFSRGIAKSIVARRKEAPILTTTDLVAAIEAGTPSWYHHRRLHPATKTFQALRIAVNDELNALREALAAAISRLSESGRIAVITFHSIEDRIVKQVFRDAAYAGKGSLVNRKPITPAPGELSRNPRARSAKLRIFSGAPAVSPMKLAAVVAPAAFSYL